MVYRMKMASLCQGVDLEGVQDDIKELEKVYFESEQFLGALTDNKRESIKKSVDYTSKLLGLVIDYKTVCAAKGLEPGRIIRLKIA